MARKSDPGCSLFSYFLFYLFTFYYSFIIDIKTYSHSSFPFSITQAQSSLFCAKYSNTFSQWTNRLGNTTLLCNYIQSSGLYTLFAGFRQLEDTFRPFNMIGYIGTFISLIMFSTTVLLYILFFRLLMKIAHIINLTFSIIFICYDVLFIFTVEALYPVEIGCKIASIFMHFFLIASFIWLTAYTLVCYILISFPHYRFKKKSFIVIFLSALIFSILLVFPFAVFYHSEYISNATTVSDSLDERFGYCWVNTQNIGVSYYIFLLSTPIVILYFSSCIIICLTLIKDVVSTFGLKSSKKLSRVLLVYIILFGLNWAICLAYLSTNYTILAYLFMVSNAIQSIFFLFGVVLIPHQEIHERIEYYTKRKFFRNIRLPKLQFVSFKRNKTAPRLREVTQAELAIRAQHEPIIERDSKNSNDDGSRSDIMSGSVDFSRLLKGAKDIVIENEIDIMDPSTFAPAILSGML